MLIGNIGKDPEIKTLQSGGKVANLSLATIERWKDKASGDQKEKTEWHRIVVWNEALIGVLEKYVHKGDKLFIEGQLQTRKYTDGGVEKYTTEIVLQGFNGQIVMLGSKGGGETKPASTSGAPARSSVDDDAVPF